MIRCNSLISWRHILYSLRWMCDWHRRLKKYGRKLFRFCLKVSEETNLKIASLLWMFPCTVGCCCWLRNFEEIYLKVHDLSLTFISGDAHVAKLTWSTAVCLCTLCRQLCLFRAQQVSRHRWGENRVQLLGRASLVRDRLFLCLQRALTVLLRRENHFGLLNIQKKMTVLLIRTPFYCLTWLPAVQSHH